MTINKKHVSVTLAFLFSTAPFLASSPVRANDAGAFIGGVFATKMVQNMSRRADAEEAQAAAMNQPRPVATAAPQKSAEQRIKELDKLAAGGYITPEEYKHKKKAILDGL